jgi:DNA-directed RNA polymerase specialized sigma24 family protein
LAFSGAPVIVGRVPGSWSVDGFFRTHSRVIARLFRRSGSERWGLSESDFAAELYRSVVGRFRDDPRSRPADVRAHLESLHVEEVALAAACRTGNQQAGLYFLSHYRPILVGTVLHLTGSEERAKELADALSAQSSTVDSRGGARRSVLEDFGGRTSLGSWIRALAARWCREGAAAKASPGPVAAPPDPPGDAALAALDDALARAVSQLPPRDRLRVACADAHRLTADQIARVLHEPAHAVSRGLEETHERLRRQIEATVRSGGQLSDDDIRRGYERALSLGESTAPNGRS